MDTTVTKVEKPKELTDARTKYDASLKRLSVAIEASKAARTKYLSDKTNVAAKEKYAQARQEHKNAIAEIKETREAFKQLRHKFLAVAA